MYALEIYIYILEMYKMLFTFLKIASFLTLLFKKLCKLRENCLKLTCFSTTTLLTVRWTPLHWKHRHMADIEHIFKREGICTPQAAIKQLAVYQAHAFLLS